RPRYSTMPCRTATRIVASAKGHTRYASLVPSAELRWFSVARALSGAKMAEPSQNLQCLLLGLEQGGRVCPDPTQRVGPLGAGRTLRVQPKRRGIEKDALALDLFDHRALRQHVLE